MRARAAIAVLAAACALAAASRAPAGDGTPEKVIETQPPLRAAGPPGLDRSRVANTRHNLSASGAAAGNTYYAPGEKQVCIFCHTPCADVPDNPGWNHQISGARYTLYESSTARARTSQPRGVTKLCLSCHDGTVALGALVCRTDFDHGKAPDVAMAGGRSRLAPGSPAYIGTDLRNHHPVVVPYDQAAAANPELKPRAFVSKRFPLPDGEVHCTSCHDAHDDSRSPFLVAPLAGGELCKGCHEPRGSLALDAAHFVSRATWKGGGADPFRLRERDPRIDNVAASSCASCHRPHAAGQGEQLLIEGGDALCLRCHDGSVAAANVAVELAQGYRHGGDTTGAHDAREAKDPSGEAQAKAPRHVVCVDCHNAHAAGPVGGGLVQPAGGPARLSRALRNVSGVRAQYGGNAAFTRPLFSWVPADPGVEHEHELCFKCHSFFAYGTAPPQTRSGLAETDPSVEFNPSNPSFHAVIGPSRASGLGTYVAPMAASAMLACSDCHGSPTGTQSRGVHGSMFPGLLRAQDTRRTGENPAAGPGRSDTRQDLCFRCHDFDAYTSPSTEGAWMATGFSSPGGKNLHARHAREMRAGAPVVCRDCHVALPHGYTRRRLIALASDPPPYSDRAAIDRWDEATAPQTYTRDRCATTCHGDAPGGAPAIPGPTLNLEEKPR